MIKMTAKVAARAMKTDLQLRARAAGFILDDVTAMRLAEEWLEELAAVEELTPAEVWRLSERVFEELQAATD